MELSQKAYEKIDQWSHSRKKIIRPDWDITFLEQAYNWSKRSHDAETQHRAVLTTQDRRVIATGYNGFIRGINDNILPNTRLDNKYVWLLHSENNCILDCAYQGKSAKNSIMYVTGEPCLNCYQLMYQAGVVEIVYGNRSSNMINTDEDYRINVEIFLYLTKDKLKVRHVDYSGV